MRVVATLFVILALGLRVGGLGSDGNAAPTRESRSDTGSVSDDFERSALGSNWSIHLGNPGIVSGSDLGLLSGPIAILSWAAPLPADQFSEAEIADGIDPLMQRQVFVRRRAADGARYALHYNLRSGEHGWEIKYDGVPTSQTKLLATAATPSRPVAGDVIRIEAEESSIRGYKNGQLVLQTIDRSAQKLTAGTPGMAFPFVSGPVPQPYPVFERWAGGALASPEPRIVTFSRFGSLVLSATARQVCFSVRFVSNTRFWHTFTVTDARRRVVLKDVRLGEAGGPRVLRWCGRTTSKPPSQGKPLPAGRYRARLSVFVAPAGGQPAPVAFFTRAWQLEIRARGLSGKP